MLAARQGDAGVAQVALPVTGDRLKGTVLLCKITLLGVDVFTKENELIEGNETNQNGT